MKKKIIFIIGTRPDAIKMVSTIKQFENDPKFETILIATSQHKKLLSDVVDLFSLKVDYDLKLMKKNQSLTELSSRLLINLDKIFLKVNPSLIFVQGDTSSSMFAALAAFYRKIPVAHVEAGLRTWDNYAPFPEEVNRVFIDQLSEYLFPPTQMALKNLKDSGLSSRKILITGNTGIDSLLMTIKSDIPFKNKLLRKIEMEKIITVTTHRRESFGKPLIMILKAVAHLAGKFTDFKFILPVHPNPNVKENVQNKLKNIPNIILTEPLIYPDFVRLMSRSYLIISDSGGVQEEAPVLGKPVIVLREKTERPEAVKNHAAVLTGHDTDLIISTVSRLIQDNKFYRSMAKVRYLYGNGTAGEKIFKFIRKEI